MNMNHILHNATEQYNTRPSDRSASKQAAQVQSSWGFACSLPQHLL